MKLAKPLYLIERQIVTGQMQQAIKQHRAVTGRQQKPIAAEPFRIFRIVPQKLCPQHIRRRSHAERQARDGPSSPFAPRQARACGSC